MTLGPNRRAAIRLLTSVGASLALHAAFLLAAGGWMADGETRASRPWMLTVWIGNERLMPPAAVEPRPAAAKVSRTEPRKRLARALAAPATTGLPRMDKGSPVSSAIEAAAAVMPAESAVGGAPASAAPAAEEQRAWLRSGVVQELARYFTYPPLARRHGIEGEVVLAYRIEADGRLRDIAVAQSSGHALLDRAALSDLGRVPPLTDAGARLQGMAMEDTLAITYRLRDN